MKRALMQVRPAFLVVAVSLFAALSVSAERPETPPPGMAKYVMVLWEPGTPVPGESGKTMKPEMPDVAQLGGRVLWSRDNRHVIYLPKSEAKGLRRHAAVMYLQRIWTGESFDDWDEAYVAEESARARIGAESDPDLSWGPVDYAYDGSGNVKSIENDSYAYDSAGRLIQAVVGGKTESYKYDSFGNLVEKSIAGGTTTTIPVDGGSNRLIGPEYDVAGNVVLTPDGRSYSYDAAGMMTTSHHPNTTRRNIYDVDDERIGRIYDPSRSRWSIRDLEGQVLREFAGADDVDSSLWIWEHDHVYAAGTLVGGETQEWGYTSTYRYGGRRHYHLDHLGSVRMVTSGTRRALALRDYYPFGTEQTPSWQEPIDAAAVIDDIRFTGHERDYLGLLNVEGTDYLDYMHARYYDPNKGRFLSPDPVGGDPAKPQTWNRYSYVTNSPVVYIDPLGLVETLFYCDDRGCYQEITESALAPDEQAKRAQESADELKSRFLNDEHAAWQKEFVGGIVSYFVGLGRAGRFGMRFAGMYGRAEHEATKVEQQYINELVKCLQDTPCRRDLATALSAATTNSPKQMVGRTTGRMLTAATVARLAGQLNPKAGAVALLLGPVAAYGDAAYAAERLRLVGGPNRVKDITIAILTGQTP